MAAGDFTYGVPVVLSDFSRLNNLADGAAVVFGRIDNTTEGAIDYSIQLTIPINSASTSGQYTLYLVESTDDTIWTDSVTPISGADIAGQISDAKVIKLMDTTYSAANRNQAVIVFNFSDLTQVQPYTAFILKNDSGQAIPATGAAGVSVFRKVS